MEYQMNLREERRGEERKGRGKKGEERREGRDIIICSNSSSSQDTHNKTWYNRRTWCPHTDGALGPGGDRSTDPRGLVVTMVTSRLYTTHSRHTQLTMDRSCPDNTPPLVEGAWN